MTAKENNMRKKIARNQRKPAAEPTGKLLCYKNSANPNDKGTVLVGNGLVLLNFDGAMVIEGTPEELAAFITEYEPTNQSPANPKP
jgi:hypothetical protein